MNAPLPAHLMPRLVPRAVPAEMIEALKELFGDRCSTALAVREQHGRDESPIDAPPPEAVVFCESTEEVARGRQACRPARRAGHSVRRRLVARRPPARGAGRRLDRPVAHEQGARGQCRGPHRHRAGRRHADAGQRRDPPHRPLLSDRPRAPTRRSAACARRARAAPTPSATGRCARTCSGCTVVTAQGEVIHTGTRARKSSAGYDLTRLMVGSEGTLGVMTEITLRVYPLPEAMSAATCTFPSIDAAVRTTIQIIQMGVPIARCELLDRYAVQAVNRHDKLVARRSADAADGVPRQRRRASPSRRSSSQAIASEHGGEGFQWATTPEERKKLWTARHRAYFAGLQMKPGCRTVTTDTCVPISRLAEAVVQASDEAEAAGMQHYIVGHVGDGNFHIAYLVDPNKPEERELAEQLNDKVVKRALAFEGTCSGEHGVGLHKMDFLVERGRRGRDRHDAHPQARTRSEEHPEPRKDLRSLALEDRPRRGRPLPLGWRGAKQRGSSPVTAPPGDVVSRRRRLRRCDRPVRGHVAPLVDALEVDAEAPQARDVLQHFLRRCRAAAGCCGACGAGSASGRRAGSTLQTWMSGSRDAEVVLLRRAPRAPAR